MNTKPLHVDDYLYEGLKVPSAEEYSKEAQPHILAYDLLLAKEKGLGGTEASYGEHYMELQAYYRKAFECYLLEALRLDLYEDELENSELDFQPTYHEHASVYERYSMLNFKHLYLRNTLYIEHMSTEDIAQLEQLYTQNGSQITPGATELVKRTYPDVIRVLNDKGEPYPDNATVGYAGTSSTSAYSDVLAIAFCNASNYEMDDKADTDRLRACDAYLKKRLPEIEEEMERKLSVRVTLFVGIAGGVVNHYELN